VRPCPAPPRAGAPSGELKEAIERDFGSLDEFKKQFKAAGATQFGSGWAWLVAEGGKLKVTKTPNAETPLTNPGQTPLLTMDVWEHAYYIDVQARGAAQPPRPVTAGASRSALQSRCSRLGYAWACGSAGALPETALCRQEAACARCMSACRCPYTLINGNASRRDVLSTQFDGRARARRTAARTTFPLLWTTSSTGTRWRSAMRQPSDRGSRASLRRHAWFRVIMLLPGLAIAWDPSVRTVHAYM